MTFEQSVDQILNAAKRLKITRITHISPRPGSDVTCEICQCKGLLQAVYISTEFNDVGIICSTCALVIEEYSPNKPKGN
jgi:hypothetical protein